MENKSPKVSVIIPSYNHAPYLQLRISSILNQTYQDFELLILDDCSSDDSQIVINSLAAKNPVIRAVFNTANSGSTFYQWQKGLALAQGEYIWIAESDDFAEASFLAELVPLLDANPSLVLAYCNSRIVDEHNRPAGTTADWKDALYQTTHWSNDFIVTGQNELDNYLSKTCTINNASAVLFRKQAMLDAGGVDTSFRYTGDWLMYQKMCLEGGIAYRAACLSNYREHTNNASKSSAADSKDLFERQKCFAFVADKGLSMEAKQSMLRIASQEFLSLSYNLLRRSWKPKLFINYFRRLYAINSNFYRQVIWHVGKSVLAKALAMNK